MRTVFSSFCRVFLWFLAGYCAVYASSLVFVSKQTGLDTYPSMRNEGLPLYGYPQTLVAAGTYLLRQTDRPKLLFIGGSQVGFGFRPEDLEVLFPDYEVHNLSLPVSNITEMIQVVSSIRDVLPRSVYLEKSAFVIGVWYGSFYVNKSLWPKGYTYFQRESERCRLFKVHGLSVEPLFSPETRFLLVHLMRPYFWCSSVVIKVRALLGRSGAYGRVKAFIHDLRQNRRFDWTLLWRECPVVDQAYKEAAIRQYALAGSPEGILYEEQFLEFTRLRNLVTSTGARMVIVNLPVPPWHMRRAPLYWDYVRRVPSELFVEPKSGVVDYIDLSNIFDFESFCDSTHPTRRAASIWSARLAAYWPQDMRKVSQGLVSSWESHILANESFDETILPFTYSKGH